MTMISPQCCCDGLPPTCYANNEDEIQLFLDETGASSLARTGNDQQLLNLPDQLEAIGACSGGSITSYYDYLGIANQSIGLSASGPNFVTASVFVGNGNGGANPFAQTGWSVETRCGLAPPYLFSGVAITDWDITGSPLPFIVVGATLSVNCGPTFGGAVQRTWSLEMSVGMTINVLSFGNTLYPNANPAGSFLARGPYLHVASDFGSAWVAQTFGQTQVPNRWRLDDASTNTGWIYQVGYVDWYRFQPYGATFSISMSVRRSGVLGDSSTDRLFDSLSLVPPLSNSSYPNPLGLLVGEAQVS